MARLPPRSTRQIEALLQFHGFHFVRTRGDHRLWMHPRLARPIPVQADKSDGQLSVDYVRTILREAGIPRNEALEFWGIS